jgi:hypothetical protein
MGGSHQLDMPLTKWNVVGGSRAVGIEVRSFESGIANSIRSGSMETSRVTSSLILEDG